MWLLSKALWLIGGESSVVYNTQCTCLEPGKGTLLPKNFSLLIPLYSCEKPRFLLCWTIMNSCYKICYHCLPVKRSFNHLNESIHAGSPVFSGHKFLSILHYVNPFDKKRVSNLDSFHAKCESLQFYIALFINSSKSGPPNESKSKQDASSNVGQKEAG